MIKDIDECNTVAKTEMLNNAANMVMVAERNFHMASKMCAEGTGEDAMLQVFALNQTFIRTSMNEAYTADEKKDPYTKRRMMCNQANVLANMYMILGETGEKRFDDEVKRLVEKLKKVSMMIKTGEAVSEPPERTEVMKDGEMLMDSVDLPAPETGESVLDATEGGADE